MIWYTAYIGSVQCIQRISTMIRKQSNRWLRDQVVVWHWKPDVPRTGIFGSPTCANMTLIFSRSAWRRKSCGKLGFGTCWKVNARTALAAWLEMSNCAAGRIVIHAIGSARRNCTAASCDQYTPVVSRNWKKIKRLRRERIVKRKKRGRWFRSNRNITKKSCVPLGGRHREPCWLERGVSANFQHYHEP